MFDGIIGNQRSKGYLERMIQKKQVANSLLFCGQDGIGKSLFAEAFAKALICQNDVSGTHRRKIEAGNHPDIRIYRPEGKIGMHSIASMRHFGEEVYQTPNEALFKVFIIHDADRMLSYSANALLKVFEEPLETSVIILLSSNPSTFLPTILSRCRTIHFHPLNQEEIISYLLLQGKTSQEAETLAEISEGSIGHAFRLINGDENWLRKNILDLLSKGKFSTYKDLKQAVTTISEHIETAKKKVESETRLLFEKNAGDNLSALQKQSIEKEIEGAVTMYALHEATSLLTVVLGWFRDMELIRVGGDLNYLIHRDYAKACLKLCHGEDFISLDKVQESIKEVVIFLERSTSIAICFENLFLRLNLLSTK